MYQTEFCRRSWVEVNLRQIRTNLDIYRKNLPADTKIMAVVKADAYGHGDAEVAVFLNACGIELFAVSNITEAKTLRLAGVKGEILVLGYTPLESAALLTEYDITQTLISEEYATQILFCNPGIKCQFAIDTGMNRIGIDADRPKECEIMIRKYAARSRLTGLFTHLCVADSSDPADKEFTKTQLRKFQQIANSVSDLALPYVHCLNSAGGQKYLNACGSSGIVRLGIILYGLKPDRDFEMLPGIQPVLSWKTVVSMVKTVNIGEYVGYGCSFQARRKTCVATVPTGYADGLSRRLSDEGGIVIIRGAAAPIIGRICMDQMMVDVTDIQDVTAGDEVEIIGSSLTADDMAERIGTIGYEIVCDISKRVPRVYLK